MVDVLCIGQAAYDVVLPMSQFPVENKKYVLDVKLECGGGPAANASCLLSRWGIKTAYMGQVGNDVYGQANIRELESCGVDLSLLEVSDRVPTPTSTIMVNTTSGSRTVLNFRQTAATMNIPAQKMRLLHPRALLFDGHQVEASQEALKLYPGALSVLDAGSVKKNTLHLARQVDFLITSESFALDYCQTKTISTENEDDCLEKLMELARGQVVVTLGGRGLLYRKSGATVRMPACKVKAIDTTGAGDLFHGAFVYGLLQNYSLEENLKFSSAAAALSVQTLGSRTSIPTLEEVLSFYASTKNQNGT